MLDFLSQEWPWYIAGPALAAIMISILLFGRSFGVSSTLRTACSALGAGKRCSFFAFDWKRQLWNLVFVGGALIGGFIAATWLQSPEPLQVHPDTSAALDSVGIGTEGTLLPGDIFSWQGLLSVPGFIMMVIGGFLVGFGSRYAGGCTSGHAISGLSNLQWPSLVAVVGFFIGGISATHLLLPWIMTF